MPYDVESYVHRIGRTGRAGKKGEAITFALPSELRKMQQIHQFAGTNIEPGFIPRHKDVEDIRLDTLVQQVTSQPLHEKASSILNLLLKEMKVEEAACKLISILFEQQALQGPDQIGASLQALEKMLSQANSRPSGRGGRERDRKFSKKKDFHKHRGQRTYK
jgi:ATP-dependent RNA helicase DeaD